MKKKNKILIFGAAFVCLCGCSYGTTLTNQTTNSDDSSKEDLVAKKKALTSDMNDSGAIYVSPTGGASSATGTETDPYNLLYAIQVSKPGHHVYLEGGTYQYAYTITIDDTTDLNPASSSSEVKTLMPAIDSDGNEASVTFDFSLMSFSSVNRGLVFDTQYWHAKDFTVEGAGDNGIYVGGSHNTIEDIDIHDCQDTGLQIGRKSSSCATISSWPSDNQILNCTSHDNHDPTGENSDGFACKLTTGYGNVFNGCIAYNDVDDGFDLYAKSETGPIGPVTLENCIAFNNGMTSYGVGTANSDGNGFKLGGEVISVAHRVINCLAFNNLAHGFTDNSNPGTIYMDSCTSYNNGLRDWDTNNVDMCRSTTTSYNTFKNVLSFCEGTRTSPTSRKSTLANSKDEYRGSASYSVFYYGLSCREFTVPSACDYSQSSLEGTLIQTEISDPFVNATSPQPMASEGVAASSHPDLHSLLRADDGSIKLGDLFKVKSTSPFATMASDGGAIGCRLSGE